MEGGGGRARPPSRWLAPGAGTAKPPPPPAVRRRRQGTRGPPPLPPPPPPRTPPSWGATGAALCPPGAGGVTRWGERRLDLLPRAHTGVPEQRAQQNSMEAAPQMTLP